MLSETRLEFSHHLTILCTRWRIKMGVEIPGNLAALRAFVNFISHIRSLLLLAAAYPYTEYEWMNCLTVIRHVHTDNNRRLADISNLTITVSMDCFYHYNCNCYLCRIVIIIITIIVIMILIIVIIIFVAVIITIIIVVAVVDIITIVIIDSIIIVILSLSLLLLLQQLLLLPPSSL